MVKQFLTGIGLLILGVWLCTVDGTGPVKAWRSGTAQPIPGIASSNGLHTLAFSDTFPGSSLSTQWKLTNAWPNAPSPYPTLTATSPANISVSSNTATLSNNISGLGGSGEFFIETAQANGGSFTGQGFVPPLYITFQMKMSSTSCTSDTTNWPSAWFLPTEFLTGSALTFVEMDVYECYLDNSQFMGINYWQYPGAHNTNLSSARIGGFIDTNYHQIGLLWLPANGATNGSVLRYFDNIEQIGADFSYASGSIGAASDTFHNMLILSPGDVLTSSFRNLQVWTGP